VGIAAPRKLLTKTATELKPGRFLLYATAGTLLAVGLFATAVFVPSANITLVAQAQPYSQKDIEIPAQPGKQPIRVRVDTISRSASQGFKSTGSIDSALAPATGQVVYTNRCSKAINVLKGQRVYNPTNQVTFAQTFPDVATVAPGQEAYVNVIATQPGAAGNVGSQTITQIIPNNYDCITVYNPYATTGGSDKSSTPQMSPSDFDAARAQLEQQLHQAIAQELQTRVQPGEKLAEFLKFGAPQFTTDHQPQDKVPSFTGTMTVQGEGAFYFDADVQKAYQDYLSRQLPNDQQLLTESPIQVTYRLLRADKGGNLMFAGSAYAYIAPKLDESKIRSQIVGRPLTQARFYLSKLPIKSVTIKEDPVALPVMPLLINRISLHYVVQSGAPSASNAPSASATPSPSPPKSP
jgi:hypothetical protein